MTKRILNILFFIIFLTVGQAQKVEIYTITAKVINEEGEALGGMTIYHEESGQLEESDASGIFRLHDLTAGKHNFMVVGAEYQNAYESLILKNDTSLIITMESLEIQLSTVQIADRRKEIYALRQLKDVEGTAIYAGKKNEVIILDLIEANLATNNARQVYSQIAGLNIHEGSDGGLQLAIGGRGLDPSRTSNFNTRQNQYDISADVLGYPESYYTPPTEAIHKIQILRGASSLQYGTQFGGLINFELKKIPSFKSWELESNQTIGSFGLFNSFNRLGWNKGNVSINGFYNYKTGNGYRENSNFDSHVAWVHCAWKINDRIRLQGEYTHSYYLAQQAGGLTDSQFMQNPRSSNRGRNWFQVRWNLMNLRWDHEISNRTKYSLSLFGLRANRNTVGFRGIPGSLNENPILALDEMNANGEYIQARDVINGAFNNWGSEFRWIHKYYAFNKKSIALVGSKYYEAYNRSLQGPGSTDADPDFQLYTSQFPDYPQRSDFLFPNQNLSLFAENIIYLTDKLSLTPGIRFEYIRTQASGFYNQVILDNAGNPIKNERIEEQLTLPRRFALFGVGLERKWKNGLNYYVNISQNYRSVTFSDIRTISPSFIIDPNIEDESGFTGDTGVRGRYKKWLNYDLGIYTIYYNNRIGIILDNRANRVRKNIGTAVITGWESLINVRLNELWQTKNPHYELDCFVNFAYTWSQYIASEQTNVVGNRVEFIPQFNIKSGMRFKYHNLSLSLQYTNVASQFTDAQNSSPAPTGSSRDGLVGSIPAYNVLDFTSSYHWKNWGIEMGINNLLNSSYFTRRATGYPGPGIIPSEGRSVFLTFKYNY